MADETLTDMDLQILSHFRRDRLCGACNGPLEADRENRCWKCDLKAHAKTQIQWIELGVMNLNSKLGLRRPPSTGRVPSPNPGHNPAKPDKPTVKKPVKRKARKKPAKRKTPRKPAKK